MGAARLVRLGGPMIVLVALWVAAAWWPTRTGVDSNRLAELSAERALLADDLATAAELADAGLGLELQIATAARAVPADLDLGGFVRDVGQLADDSGVAVDQVAPLLVYDETAEDTDLPDGTGAAVVSIGGSGSYAAVMDFIERLGSLERLTVIDVADLSAEEDAAEVIMDLEVRIFTTGAVTPAETDTDVDLIDDGFGDEEPA